PKAEAIDDALAQKLQASYDIDDAFLDDFICIGPRDWFHYKPGGIIPFKYKKSLYKLIGRSVITREDPRHARYVAQLGSLIARLSHDHPQRHILFIPMHMSETDSWLCNKLRQFAADQTNIRVLDHDNVSPQELRNIMARARATIGFRLHSTIIATSAGVPSINLYYVNKGRVYFDQIGQHTHALPIERVLEDDFVPTITAMLQRLLKNEVKTRKSITKAIDGLRTTISDTFTDVFTVSDEITTTQTETPSSRSKKQKLIKIIPAIFYILLIAFFILYIHSINFSKLHGAEFNWWYILLSIVFGLIFRYLGTYIWIIILRGLGAKDVKYSATLIYVYAKSWLGRYIPGTAPWILGKIYFASQHGISKNKLAVSSLLEGALQIVAQLVLSFALLVFDARLNKVSTDFKVLMTVVLIGCIICLIPPVFNFFVALAYRVLRHKTLEREHYANTQTILRGAGMYMVAAIINGFALYYIAKGVYGPLDYSQILFVMGVGTLAGAASMLAIFAPSGIGVREGIQLTLLSIIMPASFALIITVFTRIVSIITDLLFFGLASGADRITKK
ncbi:MAG TPA: lysylphosphatidylglycerol synthase domain-containing protein, partial [Candidatus Saccharimonadaceae bacterium]|nr:lysylphosphatidylglycerol synthase domain-containing protein [Candidatus Saccharimonadaceae bacterium]